MSLSHILARLVVIAIVLWAATAFRRRRPKTITIAERVPYVRLAPGRERRERRRRKRLGLELEVPSPNRRVSR
jgi:hypothetical protein